MNRLLTCTVVGFVLFLSLFPLVRAETLGVEVNISPTRKISWPEVTLTYDVAITNVGQISDSYNLTVSDNMGWDPKISLYLGGDRWGPKVTNTTLSVGAGGVRVGKLWVSIPLDAAQGVEDEILVTVVSLTDPLKKDESFCFASVVVSGVMIEESAYIPLPGHGIYLGIVYDGVQTVYTVSHLRGSILAINTSSLEYKEYFVRGYPKILGLYGLTMDANGNLWFTERSDIKIGMFNPPTKTFKEFPVLGEHPEGIVYNPFDGYVWFAAPPRHAFYGNKGIGKINISSEEITYYDAGASPYFLSLDSSGNIWFTNIVGGSLHRFNISSRELLNITGFDRPLGVFVDGNLVYVAENSRSRGENGAIAVYNITSEETMRCYTHLIGNEGPYSVFVDTNGTVWFTTCDSNSGAIGGPTFGTGTFSLFMTQVEEEIWFPYDNGIIRITPKPADILSAKLSSPADLYLEDPLGRAVGMDPTSNAEVNEIPGATYTGRYSEPEIITIRSPMLDNYHISVIGTDTGTFTLTITRTIRKATTTTQTFFGVATNGTAYTYTTMVTENAATATSPEPTTLLENLKPYLNALPNEAFVNNPDQLKNGLNNKIDEIIQKIQSNNFGDALNKLKNDVYPKTTGVKYDYYASGGAKAWIIDTKIQQTLQTYVQQIVKQIEKCI